MNYPFSLDKSAKKHRCPECNKKRFVRYTDNSTGMLTEDIYGRCDREESCGHHLKPPTNTLVFPNWNINTPLKTNKKVHYLPVNIAQPTLGLKHSNNLVDFLLNNFDKEETTNVLNEYQVGTSKKWKGATIFWQIDMYGKIRSGKIIDYNKLTGKRIKDPFPRISWVHNSLEKLNKLPVNFELKQCLFGEHLITEKAHSNKIVAIVESEKTALIMAINYPDYLWLACGSVNGIKPTLLNSIKNKRVALFPDKECYSNWKEKAIQLNSNGYNLLVSELIEELNIKKGLDLADLFDSTPIIDTEIDITNSTVAIASNNTVATVKTIYDTNGNPINVSPALQYFIDKFQLENE